MSKSTVSASHPASWHNISEKRKIWSEACDRRVKLSPMSLCQLWQPSKMFQSVFNHRETLVGDDVTQSDTHTGQPDWPATQSSETTPPDDPQTCPWSAAESTGIYTHYIQQHCSISTSNTHTQTLTGHTSAQTSSNWHSISELSIILLKNSQQLTKVSWNY